MRHTSAVLQVDELLAYLFDGQAHFLAPSMTAWLASSRRFAALVTAFRDKIRKKIRTSQEQETRLDLHLELETAYLLLREQPFSLVYEPPCGQARCPDLAVTYTTRLTFMVEITRSRAVQKGLAVGDSIADTLCSKLGQFIPQHSNILIVGVDDPTLTPGELHAAMLRLQQRAERNDPALWQRYRFQDRSDFFRSYQRLTEVLVRQSQPEADLQLITWVNPQAKAPLPGPVRSALYRSHTTRVGTK
jgi:hypothetical protein